MRFADEQYNLQGTVTRPIQGGKYCTVTRYQNSKKKQPRSHVRARMCLTRWIVPLCTSFFVRRRGLWGVGCVRMLPGRRDAHDDASPAPCNGGALGQFRPAVGTLACFVFQSRYMAVCVRHGGREWLVRVVTWRVFVGMEGGKMQEGRREVSLWNSVSTVFVS